VHDESLSFRFTHICFILLYNITQYSRFPLHSASQRKWPLWQISVFRSDQIIFCLIIQFLFNLWAYDKTIIWKVGVTFILSTWFPLHNLYYSAVFTKVGFYSPTLFCYVNGLFVMYSHMTWGIRHFVCWVSCYLSITKSTVLIMFRKIILRTNWKL
jgi:hypothetical protein